MPSWLKLPLKLLFCCREDPLNMGCREIPPKDRNLILLCFTKMLAQVISFKIVKDSTQCCKLFYIRPLLQDTISPAVDNMVPISARKMLG